jgi:hypothetical protein
VDKVRLKMEVTPVVGSLLRTFKGIRKTICRKKKPEDYKLAQRGKTPIKISRASKCYEATKFMNRAMYQPG